MVVAADAQGSPQTEQTGLLRDVDAKKGIGVVDRDGETQWLKAPQVLIPHPILIDGLDDLRRGLNRERQGEHDDLGGAVDEGLGQLRQGLDSLRDSFDSGQ